MCPQTSSSSCFLPSATRPGAQPAGRTQGRGAGEGHPAGPAFPEPASAPPARTPGFQEASSPTRSPVGRERRVQPCECELGPPWDVFGTTGLGGRFWDPVSWGRREPVRGTGVRWGHPNHVWTPSPAVLCCKSTGDLDFSLPTPSPNPPPSPPHTHINVSPSLDSGSLMPGT